MTITQLNHVTPQVGVYADLCFDEVTTFVLSTQGAKQQDVSITSSRPDGEEVFKVHAVGSKTVVSKGDTALFKGIGKPGHGLVSCEGKDGNAVLFVHVRPSFAEAHVDLRGGIQPDHRSIELRSRNRTWGDGSEIVAYPSKVVLATVDRLQPAAHVRDAGDEFEIKVAPGVDTCMIVTLCAVFNKALAQ